jgi:hypothetical protein
MAMMSFACGVAGIALFAILAPIMQAVARRAASPVAPVTILAIAAVTSHGASVLLGAETVQHFQYWNAASIFGFGVMGYVFAFGAVYKSVSLEILLEVAQRPGHAAPLSDIVDRLAPDIFRGRAEILVSGGQAERTGGSFVATMAGRTLAARVARIRRKFVVGDSGLYDFAEPTSRSPQKTPNP